MKIVKIGLIFVFFCLLKVNYASEVIKNANISETSSDFKLAKRDLSYSYSAADIGSKEGTHIKTITVIKNIVGKKDKPIKVDAKLHKDENWGSHIRDNFDKYGKIPEIPDIDDLLANKAKVHKSVEEKLEKTVTEAISEVAPTSDIKSDSNIEVTAAESDRREIIEKIPGDVELINSETANLQLKSQSLPQFSDDEFPLKREDHTSLDGTRYLTQYSTPQHSVRQYFIQPDKKFNSKDNVQKSAKIVVQPCDRAYPVNPHNPNHGYQTLTGITINNGDNSGSVVKITTPSGRTYDIPLPSTTYPPPYLAPSLKKTNNFNSSSDSNNNSNNVNNNINIGRPSFNFNNFGGTQPVNIPVNQPVEVPINNPDPTTPAPAPPNATIFPTLFGVQPSNIPGNIQQSYQPANLVPGIPGINPYLNNPGYNPLYNKGYNPHASFPTYGWVNNQQPFIQSTAPGVQQGVLPQYPPLTNQQPINPDTSAVTFPNLSDNILNNNNLIVQQNYNNKNFIPPQNTSSSGSFSVFNSNFNPGQPYSDISKFIPTPNNKINYAIPYTNIPKRSSNNNNFGAKQKGRSRGLRY